MGCSSLICTSESKIEELQNLKNELMPQIEINNQKIAEYNKIIQEFVRNKDKIKCFEKIDNITSVSIPYVKDKDYKSITSILGSKAVRVNAIKPRGDRGLDSEVLREEVSKYCNDTKSYNDYKKAYDDALELAHKLDNSVILVCGTLSVLGEMKKIINTTK